MSCLSKSKIRFTPVLLLGLIFLIMVVPNDSEAVILVDNLGIVNDLIVSSDDKIYFFERDMDITSPYWIEDTKIVTLNENGQIDILTEDLFIFPTELIAYKDQLIFASLSKSCTGQITCDYQDIVKISKSTGEFSIIENNLKSAIHISSRESSLVVSESNGKIWDLKPDDSSKHLLYEGENLIMDLASDEKTVYWIEEIEDHKNSIKSLETSGESTPEIIAQEQKIPYSIGVEGKTLHWNEIFVKGSEGRVAEFTAIHSIQKDNSFHSTIEFENNTPLSKNSENYGPFLVHGNFLFLVNNTKSISKIHMIDLSNRTVNYELGEISGYEAKFMRNNQNNLYVVGEGPNGFVIDQYVLPVSIPEFSLSYISPIIAISLSAIIFVGKSFRY